MNTTKQFDWRAYSLAWRMGYTIAVPIILLALVGRMLDTRFDTSPIFLLVGIVSSIAFSTYGIWRILAPIMEELSQPRKETQEKDKIVKE